MHQADPVPDWETVDLPPRVAPSATVGKTGRGIFAPLIGLVVLGVIWSWRAWAASGPTMTWELNSTPGPDGVIAAGAGVDFTADAQDQGRPDTAAGGEGVGSDDRNSSPATTGAPEEPATPSTPATSVWVHVAGAVRRPGVYRLPADGRVVDAVTAAGGAAEDAALHAINLAAPLADGVRIEVPHRRDVETGRVVVVPGLPTAGTPGNANGPHGGPVVDINSASQAELEQLPGIGPALAQRIIAHREIHGPFRKPEDLGQVEGIGDKKLAQLLPHIRTGP